MREIDEHTITDAAIEQMAATPNPRLKQVMEAAVRHLHAFAREVDLTPEEWLEGIAFLTKVGQKCTPHRQETILLSDVVGLSALVNALNERRAREKGTTSSLVGPFYRNDAPQYAAGASLSKHAPANLTVSGTIRDRSGRPVPHATVQVWQSDDEGAYDLQKRDPSQMDLRGALHTDADGKYGFRTLAPVGYSIPLDGPVGALVLSQNRHGCRPGHIHFLISADGYREITTAIYFGTDQYIETDTVFGVSQSLVVFPKRPEKPGADATINFDFTLSRKRTTGSGRVGADPSQIMASI